MTSNEPPTGLPPLVVMHRALAPNGRTLDHAGHRSRHRGRRRALSFVLLASPLVVWKFLDLCWKPQRSAFIQKGDPQPEPAGDSSEAVLWLFRLFAGLGAGCLALVSTYVGILRQSDRRVSKLQDRIRHLLKDSLRQLSSGPWAGVVLVSLYVATDLGVFFAYDAANDEFSREAALLVSSGLALLIGGWLSWRREGKAGLWQALAIRYWIRLLPISSCFSLATWAQMHAISDLSPVLVKVFMQLKLPGTVILSALLLRHRYSFPQINALMAIFLAVTAFMCAKVGCLDSLFAASANGGLTCAARGFLFAAMAVVLNSLASCLSELAFRISADVPYHTTVVHIKAGEILMAMTLYFMSMRPQPLPLDGDGTLPFDGDGTPPLDGDAAPPLRPFSRSSTSMFTGFDAQVWLLVALLVLDSWMSGLLVKRMSSVVKSVAKCMSLVVTYVLAVFALQTEPIVLLQLILALLVINGIAAFSYVSSAQTRHVKERPSSGSVAV